MYKSIIILIHLIIPISGYSTDPGKFEWTEGRITLVSGEIIEGELSYDRKADIVKIRSAGLIKAYTPLKVRDFTFLDRKYGVFRNYFALPLPGKSNLAFQFYELLHEGRVALLVRSNTVKKEMAELELQHFYDEDPNAGLVKTDKFFLMKPDGEIYQVEKDEQILEILEQDQQIKMFIDNTKLNLTRRGDMLRLVLYYDTLGPEI